MRRVFGIVMLTAVGIVLFGGASARAQDTPAAKATRDRLKKIILDEVDWKEDMTKAIFDDIKREANNKISFKIDNTTGMSNNARMSYKAKRISVEKVLNDLADKFEFGWYVISDKKDRYDGWVMLRKSKGKERGYEAGKEPKEKSSRLESDRRFVVPTRAAGFTRFIPAEQDHPAGMNPAVLYSRRSPMRAG